MCHKTITLVKKYKTHETYMWKNNWQILRTTKGERLMINKRDYKKNISQTMTLMTVVILCFQIFSFNIQGYQEDIVWSCTIKITSSDGTGNQLVFGEATDAKDEDQDKYDVMAPPFPPTVPNINTRFITNMEYPYDELMHEYKQYSNGEKIWNLSVVWLPEPGNESSTNITISWNSSELAESEYTSIALQKNNTNISNMLSETSYVFTSSGNEPHIFKIVCQKNTSEGKNNDGKSIPFLSASFVLIVIILMSFIIFFRRKAKT